VDRAAGGQRGELRLGNSRCEGPAERDPHFGTTRIEVRLAHGPLRPPVRMRLEIEPWSPTATALELIPRQAQIRIIGAQPSARTARLPAAHSRHRSARDRYLRRPLTVTTCYSQGGLRTAASGQI
jgi:hypothetical protein